MSSMAHGTRAPCMTLSPSEGRPDDSQHDGMNVCRDYNPPVQMHDLDATGS